MFNVSLPVSLQPNATEREVATCERFIEAVMEDWVLPQDDSSSREQRRFLAFAVPKERKLAIQIPMIFDNPKDAVRAAMAGIPLGGGASPVRSQHPFVREQFEAGIRALISSNWVVTFKVEIPHWGTRIYPKEKLRLKYLSPDGTAAFDRIWADVVNAIDGLPDMLVDHATFEDNQQRGFREIKTRWRKARSDEDAFIFRQRFSIMVLKEESGSVIVFVSQESEKAAKIRPEQWQRVDQLDGVSEEKRLDDLIWNLLMRTPATNESEPKPHP